VGSYMKYMEIRGKVVVIADKGEMHILNGKNRTVIKVRYYEYEDGYCISLYRNGDLLSIVTRFKGTIKIGENKIYLIDFYQIPPIQPAVIIEAHGNKVSVFIRRDIYNKYTCPPPPEVKIRSWAEAMYKAAKRQQKKTD